MADNSGAEKISSPLREIVRKKPALWWTGGAVVLIALVVVTWLERKRIPFSSLHKWISSPPDWFMPVGLGFGALLSLAILWKVPQWQVRQVKRLDAKERFDRVNEARKTLAQILGGIVLLAGFFGTWQNIKVAQESLTVSQQGQITDRFTKAIEQLGAVDANGKKKLEVRLGGIYALERIANDSERDHWPIMEVLCTYVRENAPRRPWESAQKNQPVSPSVRATADVQAILTVLGRRYRRYEGISQYLDLSGANLSGANLSVADLSVADLFEANLSGTILWGADLRLARNLTQEQINQAKGDNTTQLPFNLQLPEGWKK